MSQRPAGWTAVAEKDSELGLDGKHKERIAILEGWVKRHPAFADAHARLGGAYESLGRDLVSTRVRADVERGRQYFERALTHFKRALDLGGEVNRDITIRATAELLSDHPFGLSRPAERAAFVRAAVERFPRAALVEGIWSDLEALPESPAQARLLAHSHAVLDEALKADPRHYDASAQKEEILRAQARRSKDPARARALVLEADRLRDSRMRRVP